MRYEDVVGRARDLYGDRVQVHGPDDARCPCPAHRGDDPNLAISRASNGTILKCWSHDCSTAEIAAAFGGLKVSDLFYDAPVSNGRPNAETGRYRYVDEGGVHGYDAVRKGYGSDKTFHLEPANGKRGKGAMKGVRRLLYRLPRLLEALDALEPVLIYIPEGERDVESIELVGGVATTNSEGASHWPAEFNPLFKGARVVVIADRDEAGRKRAADLRRQLEPLAASFREVEAITGNDVTDHLRAGHTLGELQDVSEADTAAPAPPIESDDEFKLETWSEFRDTSDVEVVYVIDDLVPEGELGFCPGGPKAGKTWFMLAAAISAVTGKPYMGRFTVNGRGPSCTSHWRARGQTSGPASAASHAA